MTIKIFTDGSFKKKVIAWGFVVVDDGIEIFRKSGTVSNPPKDLVKLANVGAEIKAVQEAIFWAKSENISDVIIYTDYQQIETWSVGRKKPRNYYIQKYSKWIKRQTISVVFKWIGRNSGNRHNKSAHKIANKAARVAANTGD